MGDITALIAGNADQLDSLRQKAAVLAAEAPDREAATTASAAAIDDDDVEMAYLREKQARMPA